jgi:hypothetical protein
LPKGKIHTLSQLATIRCRIRKAGAPPVNVTRHCPISSSLKKRFLVSTRLRQLKAWVRAAPSNRFMANLGAISIVTSHVGDDFIFGN